MATKWPKKPKARAVDVWTCIDQVIAASPPVVYLSAFKYNVWEQEMWASPRAFSTYAAAQADVDREKVGRSACTVQVLTLHIDKR